MIPEMTHPYGRHWEQPSNIRSAPMDETHVLLTPDQFQGLHEYSSTYPSGVYEGKCWKRMERGEWLLAWYDQHPSDADLCSIMFRSILIVCGEVAA